MKKSFPSLYRHRQNEEYHRTIRELVDWLERTEEDIQSAEPIDLTVGDAQLAVQLVKFTVSGYDFLLVYCVPDSQLETSSFHCFVRIVFNIMRIIMSLTLFYFILLVHLVLLSRIF